MGLASCAIASTVCAQLATGFTMQPSVPHLPTIVVAAYQPVTGCEGDIDDLRLSSGCRAVPKPRDYWWSKCPSGRMNCHLVYNKLPSGDLWEPQDKRQLPPVIVTKQPARKAKHRPVRQAAPSGAAATAPSKSVLGQVLEQTAEQAVRQGIVMGAQLKGGMLGAAGGPLGMLAGSWIGCTLAIQGLLAHDFYAKERWDLHPEIAMGNLFHSIIGCSLVGFIQRTKEATTDRDRIVALAGGLTLVPIPLVSLAGQLAPAGNALLPKGNTMLGGLVVLQQRKPYHNGEAWAATTP